MKLREQTRLNSILLLDQIDMNLLKDLDVGFLVIAVILVLLLFPLIRSILWRLFRFDSRVANLLSQAKSSEVRVARIVEQLSPLLDDFPVTPDKQGTTLTFIGQPIDYIYFDPQIGITFLEIKSGNSKMSEDQRALKRLIEEKKVFWKEFRVK